LCLSKDVLLITGINGFVGRGLAEALQESGRLVKGTIRSGEGNAGGEGRQEDRDWRPGSCFF